MVAELVTPIDELTGLPLPILQLDTPPNEPDSWEDFHHHFHPRLSTELQGLDGLAVRYSRGQVLPRWLHQRYHDLFVGPPLPVSKQAKFTNVILAVSGVVPVTAVDLSVHGSFREVRMNEEQYQRVADPMRLHFERFGHSSKEPYKRNKIGQFFAEYLMSQDFSGALSGPVTDEFLLTEDDARRKELGSLILRFVANETVAEITPIYQEMRHQGLVQPAGTIDLYKAVKRFFPKARFSEYHSALHDKLAV